KKTLFWSYERGSWQYDVMCVLILLFIFLAPNRFFQSADASKQPRVVAGDDLGPVESSHLKQEVSKYLSKIDGHDVQVSRIEIVTDESGKVKYLVHEK